MATPFKTPGVYIEEKNAFPNSIVAVATAVPVFIGYTEKADRNGQSLIGVPTAVDSMKEYTDLFGKEYHHQFGLTDATHKMQRFTPTLLTDPATTFYLYNCLRLSYANGLGRSYIMSLGTYGNGVNKKEIVDIADFPDTVFDQLAKTPDITMVVIPDFVNNRDVCYGLYRKVLQHCSDIQSRMGIFDVISAADDTSDTDTFDAFRTAIGTEALNYGAAYYPWLHTSIVQEEEINFTNLAVAADDLKAILPEQYVAGVITKWQAENAAAAGAAPQNEETINTQNNNLHRVLQKCSPTYIAVMDEIRNRINLLPPAAAMAGIWCMVDNTRGVWKAPANVSVSMVNAPAVNITSEEQQQMNVDLTGKSINAIRAFAGQGILVWGGRTLDGNSQDWRYINVRRTMIMIEQSLKLACSAYVFEPNTANTWVTIKSMISNFLTNLWQVGALQGAKPEDAFAVQVGLGTTMTSDDILNGVLRVTVLVALVRPAEFIVITFQQQQQAS
jgi:phage tail sheath protein FI